MASCLKATFGGLIFQSQPAQNAAPVPPALAKKNYQCRIFGMLMLLGATTTSVVGILFVAEAFGTTSIIYFYSGTCFLGSVTLIALAAIGLCGDHTKP